jgi:DNA-binding MarR family transcriptional regulator
MKVITSQIRSDIGLAVALRIVVSRLARRIRAERAAEGLPELSDTQFAALAALVRHAPMTPGGLAAHEKVQPPSMTRAISVLEERGLVTRAPHPADRRQVALTATPAGQRLVEQVRRLREAWLATRLRELSAQERAVLRAAAPVLEKLSLSLPAWQPRRPRAGGRPPGRPRRRGRWRPAGCSARWAAGTTGCSRPAR